MGILHFQPPLRVPKNRCDCKSRSFSQKGAIGASNAIAKAAAIAEEILPALRQVAAHETQASRATLQPGKASRALIELQPSSSLVL